MLIRPFRLTLQKWFFAGMRRLATKEPHSAGVSHRTRTIAAYKRNSVLASSRFLCIIGDAAGQMEFLIY